VTSGTPEAGPRRPPTVARPSVWETVTSELRWTLRGRIGWLAGIGVNLLAAVGFVAYGVYDTKQSDLRVAGLATGIALWVLADVINTNQFGSDAERVAAELEAGRPMWLVIIARNASLAFVLVPLTIMVSVVARLAVDRWRSIPAAVMLDLFVVSMWLGIGSIASVLLPYRPITFLERWRARRSWVRWGVCLGLPYLVLLGIGALSWPPAHIARAVFGRRDVRSRDWAEVYMVWGFACWAIGVAVAAALVERNRDRFLCSLRRPT
jgi:hypothetical protein